METIFLTDKDYERLHQVVKVQRRSSGPIVVEALSRELKRAHVVPSQEIPQDIVTMHSRVRLRDIKSPAAMEITIVYPHQADILSRKVSVLAPVGTAILGCQVGEVVKWPVAKGNLSYRIEEIIYQPEAAGDFNL
jgi:regulator of nucleoside diphosphate kinase